MALSRPGLEVDGGSPPNRRRPVGGHDRALGRWVAVLSAGRGLPSRVKMDEEPSAWWIAGNGAISAILLFTTSETIAWCFRAMPFGGPKWGLDHRVPPETYETFVAALVGSLAGIMALFFAVVGVVAAAAYTDVSGGVRALFLRGREISIYVKIAVHALVFGTVLLASHAVGYHPFSASVVVFCLLSLAGLVTPAALSVGIFSFFDPGRLAAPFPQRFEVAVSRATSPGNSQHGDQSRAAREEAAQAIRMLREVLQLASRHSGTELTASTGLASTLTMWQAYARRKPSIPTGSAWFPLVAREPNWLTVNPFEMQDPLTPAVVRRPPRPDLLWAERELVENYVLVLRPAVQGEDWQTAAGLVDPASQLAAALTSELQVREALLLCRATSAVIDQAADVADLSAGHGEVAPDRVQRRQFRTAAVQAGMTVRAQLWCGLAIAASRLSEPAVADRLDAAVKEPYGQGVTAALPVSWELREMLSVLRRGLDLEQEAHGKQVSPEWWLRHHAARSVARSLFIAAAQLQSDLHAYVRGRLGTVAGLDDGEVLAALVLSALEVVHLAEHALEQVTRAATILATLQQDAAGDRWPEWKANEPALHSLRIGLVQTLATASGQLSDRPHTGDAPDLFGRAFHVLVDALFDAVMDGDDKTSAVLFPTAIELAYRASIRAAADVDDQDQPETNLLIHYTAPLTDMMLVSGYALFMHEFNASQVWLEARKAWDPITAEPNAVSKLAIPLFVRRRISVADTRRARWEQKFASWLEDHGLGPLQAIQTSVPTPGGQLPINSIVAAVLEEHGMSTFIMADLFLLEYLASRPGSQSLTLDQTAIDLKESLAAARENVSETSEEQ